MQHSLLSSGALSRQDTDTRVQAHGRQLAMSDVRLRKTIQGYFESYKREDASVAMDEFVRTISSLLDDLENVYRTHDREDKVYNSEWTNDPITVPEGAIGNYNRTRKGEACAVIYEGLKLGTVGEPNDLEQSCSWGDSYPGYVIVLDTFNFGEAQELLRRVCSRVFPNVEAVEFFVKANRSIEDDKTGPNTGLAEMMTARGEMLSSIMNVESLRVKHDAESEDMKKVMTKILSKKFVTHASDSEGSDDEDVGEEDASLSQGNGSVSGSAEQQVVEEEDRTAATPASNDDVVERAPKRCKTAASMSYNISFAGVQVVRAVTMNDIHKKDMKGPPGPHVVQLLYSLSLGLQHMKLPKPRPPSFNRGADFDHSKMRKGIFKLLPPGNDINGSTVVTQHLDDYSVSNGLNLISRYEEMHKTAYDLRKALHEMVAMFNKHFSFVIRFKHHDGTYRDHGPNSISSVQKYVLGQVFMDKITVRKDSDENPEHQESQESPGGDFDDHKDEESEDDGDESSDYEDDQEESDDSSDSDDCDASDASDDCDASDASDDCDASDVPDEPDGSGGSDNSDNSDGSEYSDDCDDSDDSDE